MANLWVEFQVVHSWQRAIGYNYSRSKLWCQMGAFQSWGKFLIGGDSGPSSTPPFPPKFGGDALQVFSSLI
jgi:hypothetical protein